MTNEDAAASATPSEHEEAEEKEESAEDMDVPLSALKKKV